MEKVINQGISQPAESEVTTNSAVIVSQFSGNWWKLGILMIGLVLAGSIAFAGWQIGKKQTLPPLPTPIPVVQSSPTTDPTANWVTYTNSVDGFSFRYPNDYFRFQGDPSLGLFLSTSAPQGGNGPKFLGRNDTWLSASAMPANQIISLDDFFKLEGVKDRYGNVSEKEIVSIGGVNGYRFTYNTQVFAAGDSSTTIYIYEGLAIKDDRVYSVSLSAFNRSILESDKTILDQILSTFKFLN